MSVSRLPSCSYYSHAVGFFFGATSCWLFWEFIRDYPSTSYQLQHVQRTQYLTTMPTTQNLTASTVMLGKIDPSRKYAVFSTTSARNISESLGFIFQLPLTALAWKRIGFESLIIVVGSANAWNSDPLLHTVLSRVRELDAVVMFVEVHPTNSVMISQVRNKLSVFLHCDPLCDFRCQNFRAICQLTNGALRKLHIAQDY